jgi:hypothetical protein
MSFHRGVVNIGESHESPNHVVFQSSQAQTSTNQQFCGKPQMLAFIAQHRLQKAAGRK